MGALGGAGGSSPGIFEQAQVYMDFTISNMLDGARINGTWKPTVAALTTTRASFGLAKDSGDNWVQFANNAPRQTDIGLLVEEARTNSLRRSTMVGAVVGTPGTDPTGWGITGALNGLTKSIVGFGTDHSVDYVDVRYVGTTSLQTDLVFRPEVLTTTIPAAAGQTWTSSMFFALVAGVNPFQGVSMLYCMGCDSGGTQTTDISAVAMALTSTLTRFSTSQALGVAGTSFVFLTNILRIPTATAVDFTIRIGWPQLEQGTFPSSPIKTTGAAATRPADMIDVAAFVPTVPASLFGESSLQLPQANPTFFPGIFFIFGTSGDTDRMGLYVPGNNSVPAYDCTVASTSQANLNSVTPVASFSILKSSAAMATNDFAFSGNGSAVSVDASGSVVTPVKLAVGRLGAGGNFLNGYLRRVAYWNSRLSNVVLQGITL